MSKKAFIILTSLLFLASIGAVYFLFFAPAPEDPTDEEQEIVKIDNELTEEDIEEISMLSNSFIGSIGTFGWEIESLTNPTNLRAVGEVGNPAVVLGELRHTTARDAENSLNALAGNRNFTKLVNSSIFITPFNVTSTYTGDFMFPDETKVINGLPSVELSTPVESTLTFISSSPNTRDDDGNLIMGEIGFNEIKVQGMADLVFSFKNGKWYIAEINSTSGLFVIDNGFAVRNGAFVIEHEIDIVSATRKLIQADGSFSESIDIMSGIENQLSGLSDN